MTMRLFILSFVFVLVGCATLPPPGITDWHLVYAHDAEGRPLAGDKSRLIDLTLRGYPVRIVWPIRDVLTHVMDAGFITVMGGEVFAQIDAIGRQIPDTETRTRIALDAEQQSRWNAIFATTGELRAFQSREAKLISRRFPLEWYVQIAPNRKVE